MRKKPPLLFILMWCLVAPLWGQSPTALLKSGRYDELEKSYETAAAEKISPADWPGLARWLKAFSPKASESGTVWESRLAELNAWSEAKPDSKAVKLAQAAVYSDYAYKARGTGWAKDVTPEGWKLLAERHGKAEALLKESADRLSEEVGYYYLLASMHGPDGGELTLMRAYLEELRKREPAYWPAYQLAANFMLERWGSKPGDLERYARDAANELGGESGDIIYARMMGHAAYMDEDRFMELHSPDHERLKRGFEAAQRARKGERQWLVYFKSRYAYTMAMLGDWVRVRDLLVAIYPVTDFSPWNGKENFEAHLDTSGARRELTGLQVLEMRGQLDEAEKGYLAAEPDRLLNVALTGFYLRHGRTEDYRRSAAAYDLTRPVEKLSLDDAANLSRVWSCLGDYGKAREVALKFDRSRGHNITGKLALYHGAIYAGDKVAARAARESILSLKTDRKGYQLAQAVMRGEGTFAFYDSDAPDWGDGFTSQGAIAVALYFYETGKMEEARAFLARAFARCRPYDERGWLAALYYHPPAGFITEPAK